MTKLKTDWSETGRYASASLSAVQSQVRATSPGTIVPGRTVATSKDLGVVSVRITTRPASINK
jgi:hypothetical protein